MASSKLTKEFVKVASIQPYDRVLDIGCGRGIVFKGILDYLVDNFKMNNIDKGGIYVGIDISRTALDITRSYATNTNIIFPNKSVIQMDAEHLGFSGAARFTKVLCKYVLMFFSRPAYVLEKVKEIMSKKGKLVIVVPGISEDVPYLSCIMNAILKYIPDIQQPQGTSIHSLGKQDILYDTVDSAGFSDIKVNEYRFKYTAGTFEQYWSNYMSYTANSIRNILESKGKRTVLLIKKAAEEATNKFMDNNKIIQFPCKTLFAVAYNNRR